MTTRKKSGLKGLQLHYAKRKKGMRFNDPFFKIVDSVQLVKEDFLRFILLAIICFFFGGTETAIMLGPLYALLVLALITIFTLISLVFWVKTKQKVA